MVRGLLEVLGAVGDDARGQLPDVRPRRSNAPDQADRRRAGEDDDGTPWHFKLLVVAVVVYLVWRFYQLFFG